MRFSKGTDWLDSLRKDTQQLGSAPGLTCGSLAVCVCVCCRDGVPYCEADYHAQYGVKCETCSRYISGRVLEVSSKQAEVLSFFLNSAPVQSGW